MDDNSKKIDISTGSIIKVVLIGLIVWFLFVIKDVLLLLLISIVLSSAMDPLVDYLQKKRIPRTLSVLVVYLLFIGIVVLVVYLLIPPISNEFNQISQSNFLGELTQRLGGYRENLNQIGIGQTIENNIRNWASTISQTLFSTTRGLITGIISTITVFVMSFYLTIEENGLKNLAKQLVPFKHQSYTVNLVSKIQKKIGYWILGQLILSFVIFLMTYIGLLALRVDFALVLAIIAGILEVIPYLGPFLSAIPAVFFAFLVSPTLALAVIVLYILIQQLENHLIVPLVMSKSTGLNPVVVILSILIGGILGGVIGAVLAIPVVSGMFVYLQDIWRTE